MSFWAGVVQGVKDVDVLKEKEALAAERERIQKYNEARDRKADARWESQWERQQEQYLAAQERLDRGEELAAEALEVNRGLAILEAGGSVFAGAMSGTGNPSGVNSGPVPSGVDMRSGVIGIQSELKAAGGLDNLSPGDQEFFKTVIGNPAAATGILAFVEAQRKAGNDLPISELPRYIQLHGVMEGAGAEAYNSFKEDFIAGNVDMKDPEQFLRGMQALKQYKPAELIWGQSNAVDSPQTQALNHETWELNTILSAQLAMASMPEGPEKSALLLTLSDARKTGKDDQAKKLEAFSNLWDQFGREAAAGLDLTAENNPRLKPYFAADAARIAPTALAPTESPRPQARPPAELPPAELPPATPAEVPPSVEMPTFATQDEANAWYTSVPPEELAKVPSVRIAGKVYNNAQIKTEQVELIPSQDSPDVSTSMNELNMASTEPSRMSTTITQGDTAPVNEGIGDLAKPSPLDTVAKVYEAEKGSPLTSDEELAVGIEAIVKGLSGNGMDQAQLDDLIIELQGKFGDEKVQQALILAMNPQQ